jgi:hypothetical protein
MGRNSFVKVIFYLSLTCLFAECRLLYSAGLSTPFADVYLDNLRIGETYNLTERFNLPFRVYYKAGSPGEIWVRVEQPPANEVPPPYEVIPDTSWIRLSKYTYLVLPFEEAVGDVIISIPNDEKYLGKKYQAYLRISAESPRNLPIGKGIGMEILPGLLARIRFSIAPKPLTEEEKKKIFQQVMSGALDVMVSPEKIFMDDIPVGEKVDSKKKYNKSIKIVNPTENKAVVELKIVTPREGGYYPPKDYEYIPLKSVKLKKEVVKLNPNTIYEVPFILKFPKSDEFKGKQFFFVVRVLIKSASLNVHHYIRAYLTTRNGLTKVEEKGEK